MENYNGFIKHQLGKHRIINWVNFIDFIKKESQRSIEKLMNSQPNNIIYFNDMKENLTLNKDNKSNIVYSNDYNIIEKNNLNTYVEVDKTLNIKTDNEDNIIFKIIYSKLGFENIGNTCMLIS